MSRLLYFNIFDIINPLLVLIFLFFQEPRSLNQFTVARIPDSKTQLIFFEFDEFPSQICLIKRNSVSPPPPPPSQQNFLFPFNHFLLPLPLYANIILHCKCTDVFPYSHLFSYSLPFFIPQTIFLKNPFYTIPPVHLLSLYKRVFPLSFI